MFSKKYCLFFAFSCLIGLLSAQNGSLESSFYQGTVWRHSPKLTTQTGEGISGFELGYQWQTTGRQNWEAWQRYPAFGASLSVFTLGDGSHERAFSLLPHLSIPLFRAGKWAGHFRVGTGFSWVTKPYDYFSNPTQNALGSHWNNITQFRFGAQYRLLRALQLSAGGSMTHFSNGGLSLPNFGINIFSAWVGVSSPLNPAANRTFQPATERRKKVARRWGAQWQSGLARLEIASFDGPKHPVWIVSGAGFYQSSQINRFIVGLDYESNQAIREWGLHSARFRTEAEARRGASRMALFVADEILFGDLSIVLQAGRYLGKERNQYVPKATYAKLSARYYLTFGKRPLIKPFMGISIKAHKFTAEYISWNLGASF